MEPAGKESAFPDITIKFKPLADIEESFPAHWQRSVQWCTALTRWPRSLLGSSIVMRRAGKPTVRLRFTPVRTGLGVGSCEASHPEVAVEVNCAASSLTERDVARGRTREMHREQPCNISCHTSVYAITVFLLSPPRSHGSCLMYTWTPAILAVHSGIRLSRFRREREGVWRTVGGGGEGKEGEETEVVIRTRVYERRQKEKVGFWWLRLMTLVLPVCQGWARL